MDIKEDAAQGGRHPLPEIEKFTRTPGELGISKISMWSFMTTKWPECRRPVLVDAEICRAWEGALNGGLNVRDKLPLCAGTVLAQQEAMPFITRKKWIQAC